MTIALYASPHSRGGARRRGDERVSLSAALPVQAERCPRDTFAAVSEPVGAVATDAGATDRIVRSRNRRG